MEFIWHLFGDYLPLWAGIVVMIAGVLAIRRLLSSPNEIYTDDIPDTVMLVQFSRGPFAPSFSPFCLKLETYLRMANIPYKNIHCTKFSNKGKMPWIRYNGVTVADSQMAMEFLNKKFEVDLNKTLSVEKRGISRAFQKLTEDSLIWCGALERWVYARDKPYLRQAGIPWLGQWLFGRQFMKAAYYQGMGRHKREEVSNIMKHDIQAISSYLGTKPFLMGPEPTEVDCTVFSTITQLTSNMVDSDCDTYIKEHHPTLLVYRERMKSLFWPDWDDCHTEGGTKQALK